MENYSEAADESPRQMEGEAGISLKALNSLSASVSRQCNKFFIENDMPIKGNDIRNAGDKDKRAECIRAAEERAKNY